MAIPPFQIKKMFERLFTSKRTENSSEDQILKLNRGLQYKNVASEKRRTRFRVRLIGKQRFMLEPSRKTEPLKVVKQ